MLKTDGFISIERNFFLSACKICECLPASCLCSCLVSSGSSKCNAMLRDAAFNAATENVFSILFSALSFAGNNAAKVQITFLASLLGKSLGTSGVGYPLRLRKSLISISQTVFFYHDKKPIDHTESLASFHQK
ncbi:hypothetical protein QUF61_10300 [Candidatus Venteria ishoeyi]|uniref:hypothetical protein n=1 Tax=Candidatus Venteria ishoeyi TaxID=1899563 RepID=UPI0025A4D8C0|nr:hypothetical protein [Candidatus Venteria ishoeyi]MDM8546873.1 hypothetical protein [Candidatus Venteria ishoeyi]